MEDATYVFLNGEIVPATEAAISPFDVGVLRGYAVFDLLQTIGGEPFLLEEHVARFRSSARMLGLEVPETDERIAEVIAELLERNRHAEAAVRMVLTGGPSPDGMAFNPATPTFFIITHELFSVPEEYYRDGASLITREHRRELPEAKTTNYITWLRAHDEIDEAGAVDVLYHADGYVSEAATASFFVVRGRRIHVPDRDVLPGTVAALVLERAKATMQIVHGPVSLHDALTADEAFITSSVRGVVPIVRIDDHVVGDGTVGPVVRELITICREAMSAEQ